MHAHEYFKQIKINMLKQNMVNLFNLRDLRDLIKRFNFANQKKAFFWFFFGFFCEDLILQMRAGICKICKKFFLYSKLRCKKHLKRCACKLGNVAMLF